MRTGSAWLRCFTETPREPVLPRGLGRQDKGRASLVSRGLGSGRQPAALLAPQRISGPFAHFSLFSPRECPL